MWVAKGSIYMVSSQFFFFIKVHTLSPIKPKNTPLSVLMPQLHHFVGTVRSRDLATQLLKELILLLILIFLKKIKFF